MGELRDRYSISSYTRLCLGSILWRSIMCELRDRYSISSYTRLCLGSIFWRSTMGELRDRYSSLSNKFNGGYADGQSSSQSKL